LDRDFRVTEQLYVPIVVDGKVVGKYYLDFLIEECLVLELKVAAYPHHQYFQQVLGYLVANRLRLGLLVVFTSHGVVIKRIIK
jgi:GxxExxY protein